MLERLPEKLQMNAFRSCEKNVLSGEREHFVLKDIWQYLETFFIVTIGGCYW